MLSRSGRALLTSKSRLSSGVAGSHTSHQVLARPVEVYREELDSAGFIRCETAEPQNKEYVGNLGDLNGLFVAILGQFRARGQVPVEGVADSSP